MHDPADRNTNSISSSMMLASPNRLLNLHPPKLSRPSQQQNLAKKMKVNHMNGVRPTSQEGNSTVRSLLYLSIKFLCYPSFFKVRKVIHLYDVH
jgi:hypothetical protein